MTREDVMSKVRKLLRLGESPNANESAAAIAKAQALMDEYQISEALLGLDGVESEPEEELREWEEPLDSAGGRWKGVLALIIARANGCEVYQSRGHNGGYKIIGRASNVEKVRYLYSYCQREIRQLTMNVGRGNGRTYANNFKLGCVDAIKAAIEREQLAVRDKFRQDAGTNSKALVIVQNAIAKVDGEYALAQQYGRVKLGLRTTRYQVRGHASARAHGREAGKKIYPGGTAGQIGSSRKQIGR